MTTYAAITALLFTFRAAAQLATVFEVGRPHREQFARMLLALVNFSLAAWGIALLLAL